VLDATVATDTFPEPVTDTTPESLDTALTETMPPSTAMEPELTAEEPVFNTIEPTSPAAALPVVKEISPLLASPVAAGV
jgi:hypothetical protein